MKTWRTGKVTSLFISNSNTGGGAEKTVQLLVHQLRSLSHPCFNISINSDNYSDANYITQSIGIGREKNRNLFCQIYYLLKFQKILFLHQPSNLIVNCELPELYTALTIHKCNIFIVEHTPNPWQFAPRFGRLIRKILVMRKCVWIKVNSNFDIWSLKNIKSLSTKNPIEEPKFQLQNSLGKIERLVFIGRLSLEKNPEEFLKIVEMSEKPALVIGDGPLRGYLQIKYQNDNLEFLGYSLEPWKEIRDGDLIVITSNWESDCLVAIEAAINNVPFCILHNEYTKNLEFEEHHFFQDSCELASSIRNGIQKIDYLSSKKFRNKILKERNLESLGKDWLRILERSEFEDN